MKTPAILMTALITSIFLFQTDAAMAASLDEQQRCADQAQRRFLAETASGTNPPINFENHYNEKLNKCFMVTVYTQSTNPGSLSKSFFLEDAFENKIYGECNDVYKTGQQKPESMGCDMLLPSGRKNCNSCDEFDELAQYYMGSKP